MSVAESYTEVIVRQHDAIASLLMAVPDSELKELNEISGRVWDGSLSDEGAMAFGYMIHQVWEEVGRRGMLLENARIALESNGHEVFLGYDAVAEKRGGAGWFAFCSCAMNGLTDGYIGSYAEAVKVAGSHAADQGGQWEKGEPQAEDGYR